MKEIMIVALIFAVGFAGFAKQHKHKKSNAATGEILSVRMQRTPCFGRCPVYSIDIDRDGTVIYTGIYATPDSGTFKKNIGSKAADILSQFAVYRVDTCKNLYKNRISDVAGLNFTVQYKDSTKKIFNAHFGPAYLKLLATTIDDAGNKTGNAGWQRAKATVK